jgi:hypothetical protein
VFCQRCFASSLAYPLRSSLGVLLHQAISMHYVHRLAARARGAGPVRSDGAIRLSRPALSYVSVGLPN